MLRRDTWHAPAQGLFDRVGEGAWSKTYSTDLVVAETLNFVRARTDVFGVAAKVLEMVFGTEEAPPIVSEIVRVHVGRFAAAVHAFEAYFDQRLSLTDAATLVVMEELGIEQLATFDRRFRGLVDVVGLPPVGDASD